MDGDIVIERADLVAGFGHIGCAEGIENNVVRHIHVAAVIDDAPAGAVHNSAARDGGGASPGLIPVR